MLSGNEHHLEKLNTLIDKLNLKENIIITGEINDIKNRLCIVRYQ